VLLVVLFHAAASGSSAWLADGSAEGRKQKAVIITFLLPSAIT
jgi:hypothetical protein